MKHLNITVTGKVQGVCFRAETREKARALGINGFVRNLPDGGVYLEAEGDDAALRRLRDWLKVGPTAARVDRVDVEEAEPRHLNGFEIAR